MQTNIRVITHEDNRAVTEISRTTDHAQIRKNILDCLYGGEGGVDDPHGVTLNGKSVLDITSVPPALLSIDDGSNVIVTIGLTINGHDLSELTIGTYGKVMAERNITSQQSAAGPPALILFNLDGTDNLGLAKLTGSKVGGFFNVNGEYLYFLFGNYSEQKVYIIDCGTLDENGDRYVYDGEDENMVETETVNVKAAATLTSTGDQPNEGDMVELDDQVYTFVATFSNPVQANEIMIGATAAETIENLIHAINGTGSDLLNYSIGTSDCPSVNAILYNEGDPLAFVVMAAVGGDEGNDIHKGCVYDGEEEHQAWDDGDTLSGGSSTTYGRYERYPGTVVAAALQRCINDMFPQQVVTVAYEDESFVITSVLPDIQYMAVIDDVYSMASLLGLGDAEFIGTFDRLSEFKVYVAGYGINDIYAAASGQIAIAAADNGTTPGKMYILDTEPSTQVHILDA